MPKIINKKTILQTRLFKLESLDINFGNDNFRNFEIISGSGAEAVMIIPVNGNNIIFIKEYAAAIDDYSITLPKGRIDKGENILDAANRELQEEIGFKSNNLEHIYTLDLAPGYINHKTHIVLAKDLIPSKLEGDEPEELEVISCKKNNLSKFIKQQNNIDSRAISCMYLLEKFTF
tara:strand:- start:229 stop:756 length:528 start_codon:yes stop_codon:yes gene_type:complete